MTLGQLDNYNFLRTRLSRRYDPPEREESHRAELRARTRRRNESADEFAENIKNLAQRAYPLADQNMLDNLVVERFREGHGNEELKKHLCLYPSTGLQDLIGACVRFETHVELGSHARKSNEGLYTVQSGNRNELTLEEVTRAARRLGFGLRPWIVRQQNSRGFSNTTPARNQNSGEQQQSPKLNQSGNGSARTQNPLRRQTPVGDVKCWTCGKTGHYAYDCKSSGPKFAFAPKALKMNFLQQMVGGTLSGGGYETIQLHRFQAATECFAETTDSVCIPPHSEVMLWAKLKTNNGRRGPTAGVVLLVGRSLVRADAEDWKIPILIYNSDPCTKKPADCTCNPVIVPAHTRIARVEETQAIQHIGSRETEIHTEEGALPQHLIDVLELTTHQRARAATLLAKHVRTFPAPGTPITGRTEAVMHDIDTGSTRPIRCNPRKLSPKKIKIQQELVDKMLEEGQIEHSVSAWSAPTVLVTKKDGTTRFCVDYRRLNNSTKKDAFPLPRIDDSLNSLSGQWWFLTLDLASGYWQVRLSEDAKPKTAFATHSGLFQFAVMPHESSDARVALEALPCLHRRHFGVWTRF